MSNLKPVHETAVILLKLIYGTTDEAIMYPILNFIRTTIFHKSYDDIVEALNAVFTSLPEKEKWRTDFAKTIQGVRTQKEAAEKVVKYEGTLNFFESDSFMRDLSQLMNPSHGITEISFKAVSTGRLSVAVKLPTDFNDIIFGQIGLLGDSWNEKLHQVSGPPLL